MTISEQTIIRETLAKNISYARKAIGLTQGKLAEEANISRQTVVQLESGTGDPKISTIIDLAMALDISPMMFFLGKKEVKALAALKDKKYEEDINTNDLEKMQNYLQSDLSKQKDKAAQIGATIGTAAGLSAAGAAIGSILLPGFGTVIGAALGAFISTKKGAENEKK
jgi:DNA-binding XRE family transcriptional regulator